jgi:hypothetical protein
MKTRFYIFLILAIIGILIVAGLVATSTPSTKKNVKESQTVTVTVLNNIGIDRITIKNMNTGDSIIKTIIDLPCQFNCTRGDYLRVSVTTVEGFEWNAWQFYPVGTFDDSNPTTFTADGNIVVNNQIILDPQCIILEISPTNTPVPTISPSPTPVETP